MYAASSAAAASTTSAYKATEKHWRRRSESEVLADADLLDVRALRADQQELVREIGTWTAPDGRQRSVFAFDAMGSAHEGFFVIPDAIDAATQLEIAHACLTEYIEAPHVTNMHLQGQQVQGLWRKARHEHPDDPARATALSKLHWGAAGYHYDWTARKYHAGNFSRVPPRLEELGATCAAACGQTLRAEAVIVNFYKKSSTMGGHQDDVEYTMDHPVVSLSLGSRCVFLKGARTKDQTPLAVLLRSGDIAILSGASRLSFHGVAKILPSPFEIDDAALAALVQRAASERADAAVEDWAEELKAVAATEYIEAPHVTNMHLQGQQVQGLWLTA
ncbi:hypothetical protein ATCC90586_004484 [Pythium insidiosum]|nr:hypothetical protein ATCC90586_004484 [Pythium insidiosum]